MSDATRKQATVHTNASFTVRQRPALLFMILKVAATEATLELGLAVVKRRCTETVQRLSRLGAERIEAGEPYDDSHLDLEPMAKMRAAAMPRRSDNATPGRGVNVALTAIWDIAKMSAEEVLLLVDRLRFDAADDDPPDTPDEPPPWADPQEQMRAVMAKMTVPPTEDRSPKFLYVNRLSDEQLDRATEEAYTKARRICERLARAGGQRLSDQSSIMSGSSPSFHPQQQKWETLIAASSYALREGEIVTDDPRATNITINLHVTFQLA